MALFAPVLKSSQPAFINDGKSYAINFSLSDFNAWNEVLSVDIKINNQTNDSSIVNIKKHENGIIKKEKEFFTINENSASVLITDTDITGWESGYLYKIQMRFWGKGKSASEWSNIMIIKPITKPTIEIYQKDIVSNLIPLFQATATFDSDEKEMVDKYRFTLYDEANEIIEQSDWITHISSIDSYRFKNTLENKSDYFIEYEIISNNGFETSVKNSFEVQIIWLSDDNLKFLGSVRADDENACIELTAESTTGNWTGNYLITRSSEKTNYKVWEELKYFQLNDTSKIVYRDYTVENGVHYKYALQRENSYGLRTNYVEFLKNGVAVNFEYSYLVANEKQLKLKYNVELSSFKRTRLESKSDTLGSQYPTILRNGYANYREFPITGLISLHMDEDSKTFLEEKADGLYYNDQLVISSDDVIDYNLTAKNIHTERLFRECVIDFLQNEPYKLFKSPTEGNILISLINVSLTPENTLGRMLYKFSATAYEMGNIDLDTLNNFNVLNKGQYNEIMKDGEYLIGFNQLGGYYPKGTDIYSLIKKHIDAQSLDSYSKDIVKLKSIKIESYPQLSNDEFIAYCYKNHLDKTKTPPPQKDLKIIKVRLDGNQICIMSGLSYCVQHDCQSLVVDSDDSWFLIDYVYEYTKIENPVMTVQSQSMKTCFGQLSGLFTKSPVRQYIKPHESENYSYSLNIWKEIQKQILDKYFLGSKNYTWNEKFQSWLNNSDGKSYISFSTNKGANILQLDIEANTGTQFKINDNQIITIGNSEKYSLIPKDKKYTLDEMITNLSFVSDCSAIVNYCVDVIISERKGVNLD